MLRFYLSSKLIILEGAIKGFIGGTILLNRCISVSPTFTITCNLHQKWKIFHSNGFLTAYERDEWKGLIKSSIDIVIDKDIFKNNQITLFYSFAFIYIKRVWGYLKTGSYCCGERN